MKLLIPQHVHHLPKGEVTAEVDYLPNFTDHDEGIFEHGVIPLCIDRIEIEGTGRISSEHLRDIREATESYVFLGEGVAQLNRVWNDGNVL